MGYDNDQLPTIDACTAMNKMINVRLKPELKAEFGNMCYTYGISLTTAVQRMLRAYWRNPYDITRPKQKRAQTIQIKVDLPDYLQRDLESWQIAEVITRWTINERQRLIEYKASQFTPPELTYTFAETD